MQNDFWRNQWVSIEVNYVMHASGCNHYLSDEEYEIARSNFDQLVFQRFGLTRAEFEEWDALRGRALCAATTRRGALCKNGIGDTHDDTRLWRALHRSDYCRIHGGPAPLSAASPCDAPAGSSPAGGRQT